ncbi:MAG TPA: Kazal-type serine protease inhibitor domain-containing protein [Kofleriaceae bacterium]|nr:Kazal-type serine protease inhibitor domain-containing protein [Kofleriaceae bacterium]
MRKLSFVCVLLAACTSPAKEDAKGQIDESEPPSIPTQAGKSDASTHVLPINVQSPHPYTNNLSKTFPVALTNLPSCANGARLHFKVARTEANYDYLTITPGGESLDGTHDNYWSQWFNATASTPVSVKLESDSSITFHGFEIDSYEWRGAPICPAIAYPSCGAGKVDIQQGPGTCQCQQPPMCATLADVEVSHHLSRGFNNTTQTVHGGVATYTHPGPADAPVTDTIGNVDMQRLSDLVNRAGHSGLLHGVGYNHSVPSTGTAETFTIHAGTLDVQFVAAQGAQDPEVQSIIDEFESLFACDNGGGLTCGSGYSCNAGECTETQSCVCTANYDPVCGVNGHTYSNACAAGCANAPVGHTGECGIAGDSCGTIFGLTCKDDFKCRFAASTWNYPFPDAGGKCVEATYCDAPTDCAGLIHPAVLGQWTCPSNKCIYQAGPPWHTMTDGHFETAHPYANNTSVWKQLYLPTEAYALHLKVSAFATERNYDFLEVWTWRNGAWAKDKTYSGTTGPATSEEFIGQYHYLRFVSDSSVTGQGVTLDAEWR